MSMAVSISWLEPPEDWGDAQMTFKRARANFRRRLLHGAKRLLWMFVYLWVLFALFALHESIVLAKHQITYELYGFAFINAWVLAKVMLVADDLNLGANWFERHPLIYRILTRALLFAVAFMMVHVVEGMLVGLWQGKTLTGSMPEVSGGNIAELASMGVILTVALIPFFVFKAIDKALGVGTLRTLLLARPPVDCSSQAGSLPAER
jgi:hypothetical protein